MSTSGADSAPKFQLGRISVTSGALSTLTHDEIQFALLRHRDGDWGDLDKEDAAVNQRALCNGGRLVSIYYARRDTRFYVITEADRSITTVLLPSEY